MTEENKGEWWDNYSKYLKSVQWKELSAKVLERDKRICQNCFRCNATQAHHVSYKNYNKLGYSLAFDCVAICDDCHKLAHPHLQDGYNSAKSQWRTDWMANGLDDLSNAVTGAITEIRSSMPTWLSGMDEKENKKKRLPPPELIWYDFDSPSDDKQAK